MLAQSLSLSAGYGGMISLAQAGFYGIGAYTTAILSTNYHLPFLSTLPIAMFICGTIAVFISSIALHTVEDYFIICTLGIQVIIFSIFNNWVPLTNGPVGISDIPSIKIFNVDFSNKIALIILSIIITFLIYLLLKHITKSSFGRTLKALSEDEIYTQSIGKNVYLSKLLAFTISAMLGSIPGVLFAHYSKFIDPHSFTIDESIFILSIFIIGGIRNIWGIVAASAFFILMPEGLGLIGFDSNNADNVRQIVFGLLLILIVMRGKNSILDFIPHRNNKKLHSSLPS
jgi:branched-chain amino acid transport system permease protein